MIGHRPKYSQDIDNEQSVGCFLIHQKETFMFLLDIQKVNQKSNAFVTFLDIKERTLTYKGLINKSWNS